MKLGSRGVLSADGGRCAAHAPGSAASSLASDPGARCRSPEPDAARSATIDQERSRTGAAAAIAGRVVTELGKVYGRSASSLAAQAVRLAADDAGVGLSEIDVLVSSGIKQDVGVVFGAIGGVVALAVSADHGSTATGVGDIGGGKPLSSRV